MSEPTPQARLIALAAKWRKQSEEGRQPTRRKGVKVLGIAGVVRNKCADELEAAIAKPIAPDGCWWCKVLPGEPHLATCDAALLPQPAERPSIEAVLDDLQSCVQNIECDCLDPPEDHDPPEDADDYRAHSQYCRRYLFGYIGTLRAALARPPVEPRASQEKP